MFSGTWFVILTIFGSIACVSWMFISNRGRRRAHPPLPPGPSGLPVVGSLPFLDPELHCYFTELAKTYGPLFTLRLGTKIGIVATSPSAAKEILKDHDVTFANHDVPAAGREVTYGGFDVLWMPYGPEWRMLRKVCVREMLGSATLDALYSLRKHEIGRTMQYLKERSGSAVNVGDEMFLTAMNVLTSMLWGSTVEGEERAKLGADFRAVVAEITDLLGAPNVSDFFPALARFDLQGIVKKMKACAKKLDDIFEGVIDKRRKMANLEDSCTKDVLQVLLDIQSKDSRSDSKTPFTMVHLKALLMSWVAILALCCIAWASWMFISNRSSWAHPPLPPGPLGLPVVGSLPFLDPELHTYFANLTKEILKDHDIIFANHYVPAAAREVAYGGIDIAWTPYGPEWRMLRKVCVREMLSSATLNAMYGLRKHEINKTMQYLKERSGSAVNIGDEMFLTAMNVVTNMLWGGTVEGEERARLGADLRAVVAEITDLLGAPNVSDFFPGLERFDLQGIVKKMKGCAKKLDDLFEGVIEKRRKMESGATKDFLQVLLQLKDSHGDSKVPFTMVHLKALFMDMVTAGTDTTSNTLEFAMAEIVNKPNVLRKAQQELDTLLGPAHGAAALEEAHALQLPYLQAIMKETLRLHPILPLLIPHRPSQSCVVGAHTVPKDSRIFVNVWAIQRDPLVWEDPLEFKPERFLGGSGPDFSGSDFGYFPFGSGRRICAGIAMAERMVLYSLASMLYCFDWKLPQGVEKHDLEEKFGITLKLRTPLLLIPSPRSTNLDEMSTL